MLAETARNSETEEAGKYTIHQDPQMEQLKGSLLKDIHRSVYVYRIDCGGCNGCEIEIFAALTPLFDVERFGIISPACRCSCLHRFDDTCHAYPSITRLPCFS